MHRARWLSADPCAHLLCVLIFQMLALLTNSGPWPLSESCLQAPKGSSHTKTAAFHRCLSRPSSPSILVFSQPASESRLLHFSRTPSLWLSYDLVPFPSRPWLTQLLSQTAEILITVTNPLFHCAFSGSPSWLNPDCRKWGRFHARNLL